MLFLWLRTIMFYFVQTYGEKTMWWTEPWFHLMPQSFSLCCGQLCNRVTSRVPHYSLKRSLIPTILTLFWTLFSEVSYRKFWFPQSSLPRAGRRKGVEKNVHEIISAGKIKCFFLISKIKSSRLWNDFLNPSIIYIKLPNSISCLLVLNVATFLL